MFLVFVHIKHFEIFSLPELAYQKTCLNWIISSFQRKHTYILMHALHEYSAIYI